MSLERLHNSLTSLTELDVSKGRLGDQKKVKAFAETLAHNTSVTHVNVSHNRLGSEGLSLLVSNGAAKKSLVHLEAAGNNLGSTDGVCMLVDAILCHYGLLSYLKLSENGPFGKKGEAALAKLLLECRSLTHLDVRSCQLNSGALFSIAQALKSNQHLKHLDLSQNMLRTSNVKGFKCLSEALKRNSSLSHLDLGYNTLDAESIHWLSVGLSSNKGLKVLRLRGSNLHSAIDLFSKALNVNTSLNVVDIAANMLHAKGTQSLCKALETNTTLTYLNLSENFAQLDGAKAVAHLLSVNRTLSRVNLEQNQIHQEGICILAETLKKNNSTLTRLDIGGNVVGSVGSKALAQVIQSNSSLRHLNFGFFFDNLDTAALEEALETNGTLLECATVSRGVDALCGRNRRIWKQANQCVVVLLAIRRFRTGMNFAPKEIVIMIAACLWRTRGHVQAWVEK